MVKLIKKIFVLSSLITLFISNMAFGGETITAREIESYFYADGKMEHSKGEFENTYFIEGNKITRTRVFNTKKKKVIPDNTIYLIQRQLSSDPQNDGLKVGGSVIRAIGQPGMDAIEILVIGNQFIQSVKSTSDYFVISRYKVIK